MNAKTNHNGRTGSWKSAVAGLAMLAGTGLWSGCDQTDEMSAMAKRILTTVALTSDEDISDAALQRSYQANEIVKSSVGDRHYYAGAVSEVSSFDVDQPCIGTPRLTISSAAVLD